MDNIDKIRLRGDIPAHIAEKACEIITARRMNIPVYSRKWKEIERRKGIYSFPVGRHFRILQLSNDIFEVMHHKIYDRQVGRV